jgi:hypothetical protein
MFSIFKGKKLTELEDFDWVWWLMLMVSRIFSIVVKRFYDEVSERGED